MAFALQVSSSEPYGVPSTESTTPRGRADVLGSNETFPLMLQTWSFNSQEKVCVPIDKMWWVGKGRLRKCPSQVVTILQSEHLSVNSFISFYMEQPSLLEGMGRKFETQDDSPSFPNLMHLSFTRSPSWSSNKYLLSIYYIGRY